MNPSPAERDEVVGDDYQGKEKNEFGTQKRHGLYGNHYTAKRVIFSTLVDALIPGDVVQSPHVP
jgi:hypothetical protein